MNVVTTTIIASVNCFMTFSFSAVVMTYVGAGGSVMRYQNSNNACGGAELLHVFFALMEADFSTLGCVT